MMDNFDFVNLSSTFGLIATGFFTVNLLLGVLLSTKYRRSLLWNRLPKFVRSISIYQVHNYTAYIALLVAFVHPILILFDKTANFSLLNIAIPPTAPHQNIIYTFGALAFYGLLTAVVTSTSFVRKRLTNRTWKWIHFVSYAAALLFLIHGLWADPKLQDRSVNFVDAEKLLSEVGLVALVAAVFFRIRYARRKRVTETFYPLKISKVIRETAAANSYAFNVPEHLKREFEYQPGQFITIRLQDGDSFIKRSYSMSSSPDTDSLLQITIKRTPGGRVSNHLLDNLKEGDELMVLPPEGSFFRKPTKRPTHYLLFAAGSGITPIYSITKSLLRTRPQSKISLIYANHTKASIIFKESLDTLEREYQKRLSVIHVLSRPEADWAGRKGRLLANTVNELLNELLNGSPTNTEYYVCGPVGYIDLVEGVLLERRVPAGKIHAEKFTFSPTVGVQISDEKPQEVLEVGDPAESRNGNPRKLTIKLKGSVREIDYRHNESILDAALRAGLNPPFACQEGVCASCKATLKRGRVAMLHHEALTPLEADQRNILTCTATAISEETVVSFDE